MKPELVRPNANHAPSVQEHDPQDDNVKHNFRAELESLLNSPEAEDAHELSGDANDEQIRQLEGVVADNAVLQGRDYRYSRVQSIGENEESCRWFSWKFRRPGSGSMLYLCITAPHLIRRHDLPMR